MRRAETLFEPRWVCPISAQPAYSLAAATVCARAGELERGREFLERAEHGAGSWAGGSWQAAVTEWRAELPLAQATRQPLRMRCAAPPRATAWPDAGSTSGRRAKRWNRSVERKISAE